MNQEMNRDRGDLLTVGKLASKLCISDVNSLNCDSDEAGGKSALT